MAEKKKWAPTKMFLQWCLSYLLISVIALTLLLASGYRYLDVLRDNLEYTNGIQLDMTRVWLDQKVKLLRNITAKESSTAAIEAVRQADDYDDIPRYDYYMLTRKISTDVINYGIGDAYFLYFPSTDAIVSNTKYGQSRRFYDLVLEAYDISYEDWMEILKQNLVTTRVFQPVVQGKHNGYYYLLAAEGGTGVGHRISAARSKNVWGPYENCPYNPILRQDDEGGYLQNCGHGKLLQTADGRWFLCFLCLRRDPDGTAPMGRETSIAEVTWTPDGWPVAAYGRRPRAVLNMPFSEEIPTLTPVGITRWKGEEWITQRALDTANFTVEKDALTLCGNGLDLCDRKMQGLLLVRQQERAFTVETVLEIPAAGTAGLTCYYDEHSYLKFGVGPEGLVLEEYAGYEAVSRQTAPLPAGTSPVRLRVTATGGQRHFAIQDGTDWRTLWSIPEPHYLTSEGLQCGKRFTGAMVGLYVHGASAVRFTDWSAVWSCPEEKR